jgi:hypothetical protein
MPSGYTPGIGLAMISVGMTGWGPINTENFVEIDAVAAVGGMGVQPTEQPSATLNVKINSGYYINQSGVLTNYVGTSSVTCTASMTNYFYLNGSGALTANTTGFPAAPPSIVPIATVAAGASTITAITDSRCCLTPVGGSLPSASIPDGTVTSLGSTSGWQVGTSTNQILSLDANITIFDGVKMALGTTTGTMLGTAPSHKISVHGATPVVQSTFGSMVASSSWTTNEQAMVNTMWVALRAHGIGS